MYDPQMVGVWRMDHQNYPPVIKDGWLENGPFIGDFPIKTSLRKGFSIAMFDYRRVDLAAFFACVPQGPRPHSPRSTRGSSPWARRSSTGAAGASGVSTSQRMPSQAKTVTGTPEQLSPGTSWRQTRGLASGSAFS